MHDKPKNELHHWWPQALSKFWVDDEGLVHRIEPDGKVLRSPPKSFGAIRNDNNIIFKNSPTVWDMSFERVYSKADDGFPWLIEWLKTCTSGIAAKAGAFPKRLTPLPVEAERFEMLAECLASLIARSPSFRDRLSRTSEYYRERLGFPDPKPEKTLVAAGVRGAQEALRRTLDSGGKCVVLHSGDQEFIFGDGFLHNFYGLDQPMNARCLIPLTPTMAVFFCRPNSYRSYPKLLSLNLTADEVDFVNRTVQTYSQRYLFSRITAPAIDDAFKQAVHLEFEYNQHPWLEQLEHAVAATYFGPGRDFSAGPAKENP
jgi:hypothetical protein